MNEPDPIALAEIGGCPEIDVHGHDVAGAIFEVSAFAERVLNRHARVIKIQHGRGKGVLREAIKNWAKREGYLIRDSTVPFETGAVLYLCHPISLH